MGMENFDFNESAYIARQSEATEDSIFAPEISTSDYTVTENPSITPRPEPRAVPDENGNDPRENDEARPAPRHKHPHRNGRPNGSGENSVSDGKNVSPEGKDEGDGNGHRPVPLPYFPDGEEQNHPQVRPAPYSDGNDAATYAPDVLTDSTARPLPDGGLGDKIVPRALTANESVATDAALANDSVAAARAIETEDGLLVAVLLDPVFLVSERRELKEELKCDIERATGKQALVTYDLGVYRKIKPDMSSEAKAALYAVATARK